MAPEREYYGEEKNDFNVDSVISYAKTFLGYKYKHGKMNEEKSFDCSHFTSYVFARYGISLPTSSVAQASIGEEIKLSEVKKGDLLFFKGRNIKTKKVGHVSLVISEVGEDVVMIHATHRGVIIDTLKKMHYYTSRFISARRVPVSGS